MKMGEAVCPINYQTDGQSICCFSFEDIKTFDFSGNSEESGMTWIVNSLAVYFQILSIEFVVVSGLHSVLFCQT